jgi:undecaprenyl-diphosphatase
VDLVTVRETHRLAVQPFVAYASDLTAIGGTRAVVALSAAAVAILLARRRRLDALALVAAVVSTEAAVAVVKHLLLRPRPPAADAVVHPAGYSFPSGHAAASLALFATAAFFASRGRPPAVRTLIGAATVSVLVAIGLTRVYLGAHYPSDVAAGWLLAGSITSAVLAVLAPTGRAGTHGRALRELPGASPT